MLRTFTGITCKYATAESDHSIAITTDGQAYSWGFSANYQTGQGTDEDIETATLIDNTAIRGKQMNWAGAGGQYSVLTGIADQASAVAPKVNGVKHASPAKDSAAVTAHTNGEASSQSGIATSTTVAESVKSPQKSYSVAPKGTSDAMEAESSA